jgi:mRNA (2'-O-methyladenosine-N6-)-methyltransferase
LLQKGVKFDSNLIDLKEFRKAEEADEEEVLGNVEDLDPSEWQVPDQCIPIHTNVTLFDWKKLYNVEQFDVIMMDPPWQLATHNPTRGVALGYSQLTDSHITNIPVGKLQKAGGFLFVWVINAKYKFCLNLFKEWGYEMVDEVVWAKLTVNRRLAKSHGFYLQHAKEVCLVARKKGADNPEGTRESVASDIIFSERRGQSQKPEEIYEIIEELVPNGRYLEIFGRKNNLRDYWVTVGNEVTGTGMPPEDLEAIKEKGKISNAVYGAGAVSNTMKKEK